MMTEPLEWILIDIQPAGQGWRNNNYQEMKQKMTKVQKIELDGKPHLYWHFSEAEKAKMKEKAEELKKKKAEETAE